MTTATAPLDIKALQKTWAAFDRIAHLRPIRTEPSFILIAQKFKVISGHAAQAPGPARGKSRR